MPDSIVDGNDSVVSNIEHLGSNVELHKSVVATDCLVGNESSLRETVRMQGASVDSNVSLSGCILSPQAVVEDIVSAIDLVLGDDECLTSDDIRII